MTRVAAIDCGTNSIRLLVADVDPATGAVTDLDRRMEVVRLGQGVDRTGRIAPEALERTLAATRRYAEIGARLGVERTRFVATSASRDAENRATFVDGVREILGVEPEVVAGEEEASLSFRGATGVLADRHPGPFLVVDIGGGSTELVLGGADGRTEAAGVGAAGVRRAAGGSPTAMVSMDVGCVRLTERHLAGDPPTPDQVAAARADVEGLLDAAARDVPLDRTATLVGVAGSVTTVTAHALGLPGYDARRIHGTVLGVDDVLAACADLLSRTRARRAELPFMHPGRVDVIGAGALLWAEIVTRVRAEVDAAGGTLAHVVTSEHDILDGIALSAADGVRG